MASQVATGIVLTPRETQTSKESTKKWAQEGRTVITLFLIWYFLHPKEPRDAGRGGGLGELAGG